MGGIGSGVLDGLGLRRGDAPHLVVQDVAASGDEDRLPDEGTFALGSGDILGVDYLLLGLLARERLAALSHALNDDSVAFLCEPH